MTAHAQTLAPAGVSAFLGSGVSANLGQRMPPSAAQTAAHLQRARLRGLAMRLAVQFVLGTTGRQVRVQEATGATSTTLYDRAGQATVQIDPLLRRTSFVYDPAGRTIALRDPAGGRTTSVYDLAGQMLAQVDPLAARTSYVYNPSGQRAAVQNALGFRGTTLYLCSCQLAGVGFFRGTVFRGRTWVVSRVASAAVSPCCWTKRCSPGGAGAAGGRPSLA